MLESEILGQPIPVATPEEANAALCALGIDNLADIGKEEFCGCAEALEEINGEDTPRCLRWFWAWVGVFAASIVGGAVTAMWMTGWWTSLKSYQLAVTLNNTCSIVMGLLIFAAVWWKGTIKCENAACIWLADKAKTERERLEARAGQEQYDTIS